MKLKSLFIFLVFLLLVSAVYAAQKKTTKKQCKTDNDCKLIFSSCGCKVVPAKDKHTNFDDKKICAVNLCQHQKIGAKCVKNTCVKKRAQQSKKTDLVGSGKKTGQIRSSNPETQVNFAINLIKEFGKKHSKSPAAFKSGFPQLLEDIKKIMKDVIGTGKEQDVRKEMRDMILKSPLSEKEKKDLLDKLKDLCDKSTNTVGSLGECTCEGVGGC